MHRLKDGGSEVEVHGSNRIARATTTAIWCAAVSIVGWNFIHGGWLGEFGTGLADRLLYWVFLGGWGYGCAFLGYGALFDLFGVERTRFGDGALRIKKQVFGLGRSKRYDLLHVKNLRIDGGRASPTMYVGRGTIAFDYEDKIIRFGEGVDVAEAEEIIELLRTSGIDSQGETAG